MLFWTRPLASSRCSTGYRSGNLGGRPSSSSCSSFLARRALDFDRWCPSSRCRGCILQSIFVDSNLKPCWSTWLPRAGFAGSEEASERQTMASWWATLAQLLPRSSWFNCSSSQRLFSGLRTDGPETAGAYLLIFWFGPWTLLLACWMSLDCRTSFQTRCDAWVRTDC